MRGEVMKALGWLIVGFAIGVASSAAVAFVVWLRWSEDRRADAASDVPTPPAVTEEFALIAGDPMAALDQTQRISLMRWLAANPLYELIVRDYCECADRHYHHPYLVATDLNGDGNSDIAVLIGLKGKEGPAAFAIFNGPLDGETPTLSFWTTGWTRNDALFSDPRLFIGPPDSDNGYVIEPKGQTYALEYQGNGG
jgi:hypothetical protein